jgi:hypothetical protein
MKQQLLPGLAVLALGFAPIAWGQPSQMWENFGIYDTTGQDPIDALTFINHNGASFNAAGSFLYNTFNTLNYTNEGLMTGSPGFDFEAFPSNIGFAHRATSFVNRASGVGPNSGEIDCTGGFTFIIAPTLPFGNLSGSSKCLIDASNIVNSGVINMNASSLIKLTGNSIDLTRGTLSMVNPSTTPGFFNAGVLDGYWGVGSSVSPFVFFRDSTPLLFTASLLGDVTPIHLVTNRSFVRFYQQLDFSQRNPATYLNDSGVIGSNRFVQAVFLANTNLSIANSVFFNNFEIAVQWQWLATNWPGGVFTTNYLYLTDDFGEVTNIGVINTGFSGPRPTYTPVNYNFVEGTPFFGVATFPSQLPPDVFDFITVTQQYAAYEAIFSAGTSLPTDVAGGNVTNIAGRIEVTADNALDLSHTRISALNYALLSSTNHFLGSSHAQIAAPNLDINLRTTNGIFAVSNLVAPFLNHLSGTIDLWSCRWTNVVANVTNSYHVLFVDSRLSPKSDPLIQSLKLAVTNFSGGPNNLLISDVLNVSSNLMLNAERITLMTNQADPFVSAGQLNLIGPQIVWSTATPGLQYLTNWGAINTRNAAFFGGSRSQPPFNTNLVDIPYQVFVNHGGVTNQASLVWAKYFENTGGTFNTGDGSFILQQADFAYLTNGSILSVGGAVSFNSGSLFASNFVVRAGGALTLNVSGVLDDSSFSAGGADFVTNKNFWTASGIVLPQFPAQGTLLSTTISNTAPSYAPVHNVWAGEDRGCSPTGFVDNAAIGRLILDGEDPDSLFVFTGAGPNSALYVDSLEFLNSIATNVDALKNYVGVQIDPNMKIYFGQALANGVSIAERLNGKNGGRFCWVSDYNTGFFSSTNLIYPNGTTNRLNTALVTSCDIDSNGNGIPNCVDPAPIPVLSPAALGLAVNLTNAPDPSAVITWTGFPATTNWLYSAPASSSTNWQLVTNFIFTGPFPGRVTVMDKVKTDAPRFYRLRVGSP